MKELKIDYTNPDVIKLPVLNFPRATLLQIHHTHIEDMSNLEFSIFSELGVLDLNDNNTSIFPKINMPKLKTLKCKNLKDRSLTDISNLSLSNLPELNRIELEDNRITKIPKLNMPSLDKIFIYKN